MNDCTYNSQYFDFDDIEESTTSAQVGKLNSSINEKDIETDIELELEPNEDQEEIYDAEEPLWSIDDDTLFYPLGLINHSTEIGKSVFVTWNEIYLQNFMFKKSKKTKKINMTKVRLTLPSHEEIKEILILDYNTLLLMKSGNVYYFSSVKSMHVISWLKGVCCISKAPGGFSLIRLLEDKFIRLEMYRDVPGIGKCETTLLNSYDITFDSFELFYYDFMDEHVTLTSQIVEKNSQDFLEKIINHCVGLKENDIVHFFTVSGKIFALIAEDAKEDDNDGSEYHIELLNVYAALVQCLKIDVIRQICIIFLQCASIDIWYISKHLDNLQRKRHFTGSSFTHYDYNASNAIFYFTDMEKVGQLEFKYDSNSDDYVVQEIFKAIPDIIVCSWVDNIQQLICLSSNNIFYRLSFTQSDAPLSQEPNPEFENFVELYELTKSKMAKLLAKSSFAEELASLPARIHTQIEEEYLKQELIAVGLKKKLYRKLFKASIIYTRCFSFDSKEILYFFTECDHRYQENSCFALIYIERSRYNNIFENHSWNIYLNASQKVYNILLPKDLRNGKICLVMPFNYQPLKTFPLLDLSLMAFVSNESNESLVISLPIEIKYTSNTFANLFSLHNITLPFNDFMNIKSLIQSLNPIRKDSQSVALKPALTSSLSLPKNFKFKNICHIFNYKVDVLVEHEQFYFYFFNTKLKLSYMEDNDCLKLESPCPIALHYAKLHILYILKEFLHQSNENADEPSSSKRALLYTQYQCEAERCYGSLLDLDCEDVTPKSNAFHLENLIRVYNKLRITPLRFFR